jgi:hypothetical protein
MSKSNLKFKPGNTYNAKYTFPSSLNAAGDIINTTSVTVELTGSSIVKNGLKETIRHHAARLNMPRGYSCVVDED